MDEIIQRLDRLEKLLCENGVYLKDILTLEEGCYYMGFTKSTMYKLTSTEQIPHYKPNGKKIFFKREELNNWLLRNKSCSIEELQQKANDFLLQTGRRKG